jgi:hypothetical protein
MPIPDFDANNGNEENIGKNWKPKPRLKSGCKMTKRQMKLK